MYLIKFFLYNKSYFAFFCKVAIETLALESFAVADLYKKKGCLL